jgi:hypothetical protein
MSTYPIIFDVKTIAEGDQEIIDCAPDRLKLYEKHFEVQWKITSKEPDDKTGIKEQKYYRGDRMVLKKFVCGVEAIHSNEGNVFKCIIRVVSGEADYALAFEKFKDAQELKEQIQKWLLQ